MAETTSGTTSVTDRRVPPRGVLPRHAQTWLLVAVALGILTIIVLTGDPEPDSPAASLPSAPASAPSTDRLRDYQGRLRVLDQRARQQLLEEPSSAPALQPRPACNDPAGQGTPDPLVAERQRREYESLFASNVVLSRRPQAQRLITNDGMARRPQAGSSDDVLPPPPTLDEVAEAVIRATTPASGPMTTAVPAPATLGEPASSAVSRSAPLRPVATGPVSSLGPVHPVLEGTLIDSVLTNRLDGSVAAPVNCLVTNPVYSHDGRYVLIPAGARVLGETKPVQTQGDTRLAVSFNRLVMPDGQSYRLDQFIGLNDIGDSGLRDKVNRHYRATFGASAAVGLISGLAQYLGTAAFSRGNGDRTVIITGGVGDATAEAIAQAMSRYLNRLPRITIREGHRVRVYVTSDFALPAYDGAGSAADGTRIADVR